jgi:hypothetical protein
VLLGNSGNLSTQTIRRPLTPFTAFALAIRLLERVWWVDFCDGESRQKCLDVIVWLSAPLFYIPNSERRGSCLGVASVYQRLLNV